MTSVWVAEGAGVWQEYPGGISDWHAQKKVMAALQKADVKAAAAMPATQFTSTESRGARVRGKLSFKEKSELDKLPDEIAKLETEQTQINEALASGDVYRFDAAKAKTMSERSAKIDALVMEKMQRWEELEAKSAEK